MPMGPYEDFAACVTDQKNKGHGDESAHKICGYIKAKTESLMKQLKESDYSQTDKIGHYAIDWWSERDRNSIVVIDTSNDKAVWECWDEDCHQMIEDGFFKWHDSKGVIKYLKDMKIIKENLMKRRREDYGTDAASLSMEPVTDEIGAGGEFLGANPVIDEPIPMESASEIVNPPMITMESDVAIGKVIVEVGEKIRILSKREAKKWKEENPIANGGSSEAPMDGQTDKGENLEIITDGSEQLMGGDPLAGISDKVPSKVAYGVQAEARIRKMEAEIAQLKKSLRR